MGAYILRRILLMIPTLLGIMAISFVVIQFAPGGPVEQVIARLTNQGGDSSDRLGGGGGGGDTMGGSGFDAAGAANSKYRGAQGLDPEFIARLEQQFGFDKPPLERFGLMLWNYARFDFGDSYFRDISVIDLILEKMPVSISLGLWITLLSYLISIPLGIRKAVKDGSTFDTGPRHRHRWLRHSGFLFAILLMILFAGGSFWDWFPLRGLVSDNWRELSWPQRILDYFWHLTLPLTAMVLSAFATTTLLTKNSFLEEIRKQYVVTARAKGLTEHQVLYGHVFRNAMLIVIAAFPAPSSRLLHRSLLIENIFSSATGLGLRGVKSVVAETTGVFPTSTLSLIGLSSLISDLTYTDRPRSDCDGDVCWAEFSGGGVETWR